jgi:hypothetical protein
MNDFAHLIIEKNNLNGDLQTLFTNRTNLEISHVSLLYGDNEREIKMKLIAGFMDVGQNPNTDVLRPVLGGLIVLPPIKHPALNLCNK